MARRLCHLPPMAYLLLRPPRGTGWFTNSSLFLNFEKKFSYAYFSSGASAYMHFWGLKLKFLSLDTLAVAFTYTLFLLLLFTCLWLRTEEYTDSLEVGGPNHFWDPFRRGFMRTNECLKSPSTTPIVYASENIYESFKILVHQCDFLNQFCNFLLTYFHLPAIFEKL